MDKFTEKTAVDCIFRNKGKIDDNKVISIKTRGLKVLSAIDYLCNHYKYIWIP